MCKDPNDPVGRRPDLSTQVRMGLPDKMPDADTAFASADTDGDGLVSKAEFAEQIKEQLGFSNGAEMSPRRSLQLPSQKYYFLSIFNL